MTFDEQEKARYSRQIPIIGEDGQEKLKKARVLIAGAGGLGSVIARYLGMAGTGFLRIVDCDLVDASNLNRHILADSADIGRSKATAEREELVVSCPSCSVEVFHQTIDHESVLSISSDVDIIVDALDNYPTRHVLNEAAVHLDIPLVHGAVKGLYGQVLTVVPSRSACMKCIFAEEYPTETLPVLGSTCGVIGSVQVGEVIKCITGIGTLLIDRLFLWNGLLSEAEILEVVKNPACSVCSKRDTV